MKALAWLKKWGWLVLVGCFGLLVWLVTLGSGKTPSRVLGLERDAIDAGEKAKLRELEVGKDKANAEIDAEHAGTIAALDAKQKTREARLRDNHPARVRYLNRRAAERRRARGGS